MSPGQSSRYPEIERLSTPAAEDARTALGEACSLLPRR
jgi:hypothetical protein